MGASSSTGRYVRLEVVVDSSINDHNDPGLSLNISTSYSEHAVEMPLMYAVIPDSRGVGSLIQALTPVFRVRHNNPYDGEVARWMLLELRSQLSLREAVHNFLLNLQVPATQNPDSSTSAPYKVYIGFSSSLVSPLSFDRIAVHNYQLFAQEPQLRFIGDSLRELPPSSNPSLHRIQRVRFETTRVQGRDWTSLVGDRLQPAFSSRGSLHETERPNATYQQTEAVGQMAVQICLVLSSVLMTSRESLSHLASVLMYSALAFNAFGFCCCFACNSLPPSTSRAVVRIVSGIGRMATIYGFYGAVLAAFPQTPIVWITAFVIFLVVSVSMVYAFFFRSD